MSGGLESRDELPDAWDIIQALQEKLKNGEKLFPETRPPSDKEYYMHTFLVNYFKGVPGQIDSVEEAARQLVGDFFPLRDTFVFAFEEKGRIKDANILRNITLDDLALHAKMQHERFGRMVGRADPFGTSSAEINRLRKEASCWFAVGQITAGAAALYNRGEG